MDAIRPEHWRIQSRVRRQPRAVDYPQINNWLKNLYWNVPGFKETTNFKHNKENYTKSRVDVNPKGLTPREPCLSAL